MIDREKLKKAFMAGFKESGEGFNYEYPFCDKGANDDDVFVVLKPEFEKIAKEILGE